MAHPVFLMHIQSLLSGYAPDVYIHLYPFCVRMYAGLVSASAVAWPVHYHAQPRDARWVKYYGKPFRLIQSQDMNS